MVQGRYKLYSECCRVSFSCDQEFKEFLSQLRSCGKVKNFSKFFQEIAYERFPEFDPNIEKENQLRSQLEEIEKKKIEQEIKKTKLMLEQQSWLLNQGKIQELKGEYNSCRFKNKELADLIFLEVKNRRGCQVWKTPEALEEVIKIFKEREKLQ